MDRHNFGLFYSLPLSAYDYARLDESGVKLVMLTKAFALHDIANLHDRGIRTVIRLNDEEAEHGTIKDNNGTATNRGTGVGSNASPDGNGASLEGWLQSTKDTGGGHNGIIGLICGCEPEQRYDWGWPSPSTPQPDWGNQPDARGQTPAQRHAGRVAGNADVARNAGIWAASPGWSQRNPDGRFGTPNGQGEIGRTDGPQPGEYPWIEDTRRVYDAMDYNCEHIYTYDGSPYDQRERFEKALCKGLSRRHKDVIVDEFNISSPSSTPEQHMTACLQRATFMLTQPRVIMAFPFCANGQPNGQWPAGMLMSSVNCYSQVKAFMGGN